MPLSLAAAILLVAAGLLLEWLFPFGMALSLAAAGAAAGIVHLGFGLAPAAIIGPVAGILAYVVWRRRRAAAHASVQTDYWKDRTGIAVTAITRHTGSLMVDDTVWPARLDDVATDDMAIDAGDDVLVTDYANGALVVHPHPHGLSPHFTKRAGNHPSNSRV